MNESEQAAFDEVQAEKLALGIKDEAPEPEVETPALEEAPVAPEKEPEKESTEDETTPPEVSEREPSPKDFKEYKRQLREELQTDYDKKIESLKEELGKAKPNETTTENLEDDIAKLAEELQFDPAKTKRIIEVARKGINTISPEDKALLDEYKADKTVRQQEVADREQADIFNTEWEAVLPTLKQRFPNASDEQLKAAKSEMDELSHSEKYHQTDMDYVLFKEQDKFSKTLFSPKQATFESARPFTPTESDEFPEFKANMTPAEFSAFEKSRERYSDTQGAEKMHITTRDDMGNIFERWE